MNSGVSQKSERVYKTLIDLAKSLAMIAVGVLVLTIWWDSRKDAKPSVNSENVLAGWDGNPNHPDCSEHGHPDPHDPHAFISARFSNACDDVHHVPIAKFAHDDNWLADSGEAIPK